MIDTLLAQGRIDIINNQIEQGIPTYLYLVKGNRQKSAVYRAHLMYVARYRPKEKVLIPIYYSKKKLLQYMNAWMKIDKIEQVDMSTLNSLKAINSVIPISETLARSSSGYFLVRENKTTY